MTTAQTPTTSRPTSRIPRFRAPTLALPLLGRLLAEEGAVRAFRVMASKPVDNGSDTDPLIYPAGGDTKPVPAELTPNQRHAARAVLRHSTQNGYANWVKVQTDQAMSELQTRLAGLVRDHYQTARDGRTGELFAAATAAVRQAFSEAQEEAEGHLSRYADASGQAAARDLKAYHGVVMMSEPSRAMAGGGPHVHGTPLSGHYEKLAADLLFRFKAEVRKGLEKGEPVNRLAERVEGTHGYAQPVQAGDAPGHEFHGNQWTKYDNSAAGKTDSQEHAEAIEKARSIGGGVTTATVNPSELRHSDGFNPTRGVTKKKIASIAKRLKSGSQIPKPVVAIKDGKKQILDGNHRVAAWKKAFPGKAIEVHVPNGQAWDVQYKHIQATAAKIDSETIHAARRGGVSVNVPLLDQSKGSLSKLFKAALAEVEDELRQGSMEAPEGKEMGWQWVAVLDANTCPECEGLDGERWTLEDEPVGDAEELERPPLHPNCRCALVPVDLGEEDAPMSFDDYLSQFSKSEQEAAFGKKALRDYAAGRIGPAEMVGDPDHLLSLEQLKEVMGI